MTRQVDLENGIEKAAAALAGHQREEVSTQWQLMRNKLDSLLLSTHTLKTDEVRRFTLQIDSMDYEQRRTFINANWGSVCLERCVPILIQLEALEKHIAKQNT